MLYLLPLIANFLSSSNKTVSTTRSCQSLRSRAVFLLDLVLLGAGSRRRIRLGAGHTVEKPLRTSALASRILCGRLGHGTWFGGAPSQFQSRPEPARGGRYTPHGSFWQSPPCFLSFRALLRNLRYKRCGSNADVGGPRGALRRSPAAPCYASFNHAPPEQACSFVHDVHQPWRPGEPRILWVLFDEMSYNQVFEHRQPGCGPSPH